MKIEFDPAKSERNAKQRGLPFELVADFDWESALLAEDVRKRYPERRYVALGRLLGRLHALCYAEIFGGVRVISLRKANAREQRRYAQETADR